MGKRQNYADRLRSIDDWNAFLKAESGLPGPRGNLELAGAFVDVASREQILNLAGLDDQVAPENTPMGFLAFCGVYGLGRLIAEGDVDRLVDLRARAHDPRWRVREAVAMALQRLGDTDVEALIASVSDWRENPFERRAAIAGLCEPRLLARMPSLDPVLDHLNGATLWLKGQPDRLDEGGKVLRKGLAYAWSVAVCADPREGQAVMEAWLDDPARHVRWVMRQNLGKARLRRLDPAWVERWEAAWAHEGAASGN